MEAEGQDSCKPGEFGLGCPNGCNTWSGRGKAVRASGCSLACSKALTITASAPQAVMALQVTATEISVAQLTLRVFAPSMTDRTLFSCNDKNPSASGLCGDLGVLCTVGVAAGEALPEQLAEAEEKLPSLV